jgi:hypothetical protein
MCIIINPNSERRCITRFDTQVRCVVAVASDVPSDLLGHGG